MHVAGSIPYQESVLYKRQCYDTICDVIVKHPAACFFPVLGAPGIGKSVFLHYVMYRVCKGELDFMHVYHTSVVDRYTVKFSRYEFPQVFRSLQYVDCDHFAIHLMDLGPLNTLPDGLPHVAPFTIIATSGRCVNLDDFDRFVTTLDAICPIYMPHWTLWELQHIQPDQYQYDQMQQNFAICGGVPRLIFSSTILVKQKIDNAIERVQVPEN